MIDSIRILGKRYAVREVPAPALLDVEFDGRIDRHLQAIHIRAGLADEQRREMLLHELIHGVELELQLDLPEKQVGALSVGLWATAQANPDAMRWILGLEPAPTKPEPKKGKA